MLVRIGIYFYACFWQGQDLGHSVCGEKIVLILWVTVFVKIIIEVLLYVLDWK